MTRDDLPSAVQACQGIHAALDFAVTHPGLTADWHDESNTIVFLTARDELTLGWLCDDIETVGHTVVRFHEPDLNNELTAAAFEPSAARLVSHLPLALRETEGR